MKAMDISVFSMVLRTEVLKLYLSNVFLITSKLLDRNIQYIFGSSFIKVNKFINSSFVYN